MLSVIDREDLYNVKDYTSNLKHFERIEENDILTYVADHNSMGHICVSVFPETETEIITSSIKLLH